MPQPQGDLRSGYTTGACATAATRGALLALVCQRTFTETTIRLPQGKLVTFPLHSCAFTDAEGRSSVVKDAGDDPDVTDKAVICALVTWHNEAGVIFRRGQGVGLVTKPGLPVPPGEPAINPAPRAMIMDAVQEILQGTANSRLSTLHSPLSTLPPGVIVEISVPQGEEMAKKTFNPRLGITGGISILGTSGIVVPYSTAAWVASVVQAIDVAVAQGCQHLVLTIGGRSERAAQKLFALPEVAFIQIGPFFGAALRHCKEKGVGHVSLVAMIGKLAKFAAGNESAHSTASSQDFDFLARLAGEAGADAALTAQITAANTAQQVAELAGQQLPLFFNLICGQARRFGLSLAGDPCSLDVLLTGIHGEVLGQCVSGIGC